jgi:hypothetical protein
MGRVFGKLITAVAIAASVEKMFQYGLVGVC